MLSLSYTGRYWIKYGDTNEGVLRVVSHYDKNNIYSCGNYTTTKNGVIRKTNIAGECQWVRELGDNTNDTYLFSIDTDSFGNVYVAGNISYSGSSDIILAKYNSSGSLQWKKKLNSAGYNGSGALKISPSNDIYFCGWSAQSGEGNEDGLIMKLDSLGNIIWQKTLGSVGNEYALDLKLDSNENLIVIGYNLDDILIVKYNSSGTLQWQRKFGKVKVGNFDIEIGSDSTIDSNDNIYIVGAELYQYTTLGGSTAYSYKGIVAKYDSSGALQWQKVVTSNSSNNPVEFTGITVDSNDDLYIVGKCTADVGSFTKFPAYIAKMNSSGNILWQNGLYRNSNIFVSPSLTNNAYGISVDDYEDLCIVGTTSYANNQTFDKDWPLMFKVPSDGSLGGVYGPFKYGPVSLTYSNGSYISSQTNFVENTSSFTITDSTLVDSLSSCSYDNLIKITDNREKLTIDYLNKYWISSFGATNETGRLVAVTHYKNNIYSSGTYYSPRNAVIRKTNISGECQWVRKIGDSTNSTTAWNLDTDSFENVYAAVTTYPTGRMDFAVVKYNKLGDLQWKKKLNSTGINAAIGLKVSKTNYIYFCGWTNQSGEGDIELLLMKLDPSANIIWQKTLGSVGTEYGYNLTVDSNENVIVVVVTDDDIVTAKYNSSGILQWQRKFGNPKVESQDEEISSSVVTDSSNNIYVAGYEVDYYADIFGGTSYTYIPIIFKYNSSGVLQWQKRISLDPVFAFESIVLSDITVDSNDNIYIVGDGSIYRSNSFKRITYLAKLNSSGSVIWERSLSGIGTLLRPSGNSISIDDYGDLCIGGILNVSSTNSYQFMFKVPSDGSLVGTYLNQLLRYESEPLTYTNSTYSESAANFVDGTSNFTLVDSTLTNSTASCYSERYEIDSSGNSLTINLNI